jgi:cytidine diphosphoramidate kinase
MVVWLIGLSGSGKSTLANEIVSSANIEKNNTILLDGDVVREIFGNDLGYSMKDRLLNARRICQLGKFLDENGMNVVCAILSIFPETRDWNRENIKNYYEVFIDTPIDILIKRDSKGIYEKYHRGEISEVVGLDLDFPFPDKADLVIKNSDSKEYLLSFAKIIVDKIINHKS